MLRRFDCMKILLFAQERPAAELASRALRSIAPDAVLAWARSPDAALNWLAHNRDADGVIVDPATPTLVSQAFLEQVRTLSPDISTAVLAPQRMRCVVGCLQGHPRRGDRPGANQERAPPETAERDPGVASAGTGAPDPGSGGTSGCALTHQQDLHGPSGTAPGPRRRASQCRPTPCGAGSRGRTARQA